MSTDYLLGKSDERNPEPVDNDKINIGLSIKDYNPPTEEQQKKIEEFAKFVLQENKKKHISRVCDDCYWRMGFTIACR